MTKRARNRRIYLRARKKLNRLLADSIINAFKKPCKFPLEYLTNPYPKTQQSEELKKYNWNILTKGEIVIRNKEKYGTI